MLLIRLLMVIVIVVMVMLYYASKLSTELGKPREVSTYKYIHNFIFIYISIYSYI